MLSVRYPKFWMNIFQTVISSNRLKREFSVEDNDIAQDPISVYNHDVPTQAVPRSTEDKRFNELPAQIDRNVPMQQIYHVFKAVNPSGPAPAVAISCSGTTSGSSTSIKKNYFQIGFVLPNGDFTLSRERMLEKWREVSNTRFRRIR